MLLDSAVLGPLKSVTTPHHTAHHLPFDKDLQLDWMPLEDARQGA